MYVNMSLFVFKILHKIAMSTYQDGVYSILWQELMLQGHNRPIVMTL